MVAVLLGLAVAASYGAADFFGGLASKRSTTASVVLLSQAFALAALVALAAVAASSPDRRDLAIGAMVGVAGGIGLLLLYRGLAIGRMSVVAPITAVGAAVVPFVWGVGRGERPSPLGWIGAVVALGAVVLVSRAPPSDATLDGAHVDRPVHVVVGTAAGAGLAFGVIFILLSETSRDAGVWPLIASRVSLITLLGAGALMTRQALRPASGAVPTIVVTGLFDAAANGLYLLAVHRGLLSLVAVLSSLYPVATVVLARAVLGERLAPSQLVGLGLGLAGVVLIGASS